MDTMRHPYARGGLLGRHAGAKVGHERLGRTRPVTLVSAVLMRGIVQLLAQADEPLHASVRERVGLRVRELLADEWDFLGRDLRAWASLLGEREVLQEQAHALGVEGGRVKRGLVVRFL